ncbi:MAG: PD-(D/E)XK nuclease family protein [Deltaproteobacteria bacterium]|nr:PD-(D/E)XK nuclease family protein [Deltaproteobacteria bacterium]
MEATECVAHGMPDPTPLETPVRGPRLLTHSAMEAWGRCEVEYKICYEDLVVPTTYPAALAIGSAVHAGVEVLHHGRSLAEAWVIAQGKMESSAVRARLALDEAGQAELASSMAWDAAKVRAMLRAWLEHNDSSPRRDAELHDLQFLDRDLEVLETELALEAPLVNPLTGRPSRSFRLAGKLDAIARKRGNGADGYYVVEFKTTGEDLDAFVEAMGFSAQPCTYQSLAEAHLGDDLGPCLGTVLDIVRKPTIRGKKDETPETFEARALEEYRRDPTRFFRREVLPVNETLRREAMANAWRIADSIRRAERYGYVSKRGPSCRSAYGVCKYRALCWHGDAAGFVTKEVAHEELIDEA